MSIDKVTDLSACMKKRRTDLRNLTPEARTYKRTRGRVRKGLLRRRKHWFWLPGKRGMNGSVPVSW